MAETLVKTAKKRNEAARKTYIPYGPAKKLRETNDREVLLSGPAGIGKSRGCLEWIDTLCREHPRLRVLIVRKTRKSMTESVLQTFEDHVLPLDDPVLRGPQRGYRHAYNYPNGSIIVLGGMDYSSRFMSTEFDIIFVPEAIELQESEWEDLTTRLRNFRIDWQQIIGDTNPGPRTHWLKLRADSSKTVMLTGGFKDNPRLYDRAKKKWAKEGLAYIDTLKNLTGVRRDRFYLGKWVTAEGLVFEVFDPDVHLVYPSQAPSEFKFYLGGVDWGLRHPGVFQAWGITGDGEAYRTREIYHTDKLIDWWTEEAQKLHKELNFLAIVCDPSRPAYIKQFREAGLPAIGGNNDVSWGIDKVSEGLKDRRIFYVRDALVHSADEAQLAAKKPAATEQEFDGYIWAKKADGSLKEEPVKVNDDGLDTTRYMTVFLERLLNEGWDADDGEIVEVTEVEI